MKIPIEEINKRNDPYQIFVDSVKSEETLRRYKNNLHAFLKMVPKEFYKKVLDKKPQDKQPQTFANMFVELAKKNPELATNIIAAFIKEKKKLAADGAISPSTLPNHTKPIRALLDANAIPIHWKSLNKLLPRRESISKDRAYTKAELQKMMEASHDITDKVIILLFSSGGFRLDAWNYFMWKDYVPFREKDGSFKGGALLVYRGDPEEYWTFITPEACKMLELYKEQWKSEVGINPKPDDPILKAVRHPVVRRLNSRGIKKRIEIIVKRIGLRPPLPQGKRRHEVQLDHGFRKYFNTMLRRAKVNYLDKEDMLGHKVGLEKHYERYQEEDFERFPEYQKAIPFLTISDEEGLRFENQQKQRELEEIQQKNLEIEDLTRRVDDLENGSQARWNDYFKGIIKAGDNSAERILLTIFQFWFEMRATEEEKREIWRKIQQAKKEGKSLNVSELGLPKRLSLQNMYSDLDKT